MAQVVLSGFDSTSVRLAPDSLYYEHFYSRADADRIYAALQSELVYVPRDHPGLQFAIFGKTMQLPREKAFLGDVVGDRAPQYRYNGTTATTYPLVEPWTPTTHLVRDQLLPMQRCNHLVANRYATGSSHIGYHYDKSQDFTDRARVLTVSFGAERRFELKHSRTGEVIKMTLEHGSLFVLGAADNAEWKHRIVKETSKRVVVGERISLTYRSIGRFVNQRTGEMVEGLGEVEEQNRENDNREA